MNRLFAFLFYCLYLMFKSLKRIDENDEQLSSSFYSILLSTNTILLLFPLRLVIPKGFFDPLLLNYSLKFFLASIFIGWYFFCKWYFIKRENDSKIIEFYKNFNRKPLIITGIFYCLLTFISFIVTAQLLGKY